MQMSAIHVKQGVEEPRFLLEELAEHKQNFVNIKRGWLAKYFRCECPIWIVRGSENFPRGFGVIFAHHSSRRDISALFLSSPGYVRFYARTGLNDLPKFIYKLFEKVGVRELGLPSILRPLDEADKDWTCLDDIIAFDIANDTPVAVFPEGQTRGSHYIREAKVYFIESVLKQERSAPFIPTRIKYVLDISGYECLFGKESKHLRLITKNMIVPLINVVMVEFGKPLKARENESTQAFVDRLLYTLHEMTGKPMVPALRERIKNYSWAPVTL